MNLGEISTSFKSRDRIIEEHVARGIDGLALGVGLGVILISVGIVLSVVYVCAHFIAKFW